MTAGRQITHAAADTTSPAGDGLRAGGRILAGETLGRGSGTEDDTRMAVIDRVSRSARARPGRAGWVIAAGSAAVLAVLFAWPATRYALTSADPTNIDPLVAFTLGFGVVGALILSRLGSNALGWLYAGAGGIGRRGHARALGLCARRARRPSRLAARCGGRRLGVVLGRSILFLPAGDLRLAAVPGRSPAVAALAVGRLGGGPCDRAAGRVVRVLPLGHSPPRRRTPTR